MKAETGVMGLQSTFTHKRLSSALYLKPKTGFTVIKGLFIVDWIILKFSGVSVSVCVKETERMHESMY